MAALDVIFVLPYLFSDHPSFPEGILKKALEHEGFRVGVIERPFWQKKESFAVLGRPRLFFAVIPGPMDSVVLNYTSGRKRRREDLYQAEGKAFFEGHPPSIKYKVRPDRTAIVFSNRIKEVYHDVPIIIGGIEASLRCFAHYDFQQDRIRPSILIDSRASLLVHGMGEKQLAGIARRLEAGSPLSDPALPGTAAIRRNFLPDGHFLELPPYEAVVKERVKLMESYLTIQRAGREGRGVVQRHGNRWVVAMPPEQYGPSDLDRIYDRPYKRRHLKGDFYSPALRMNLFSVTSHRGCGGGCAFCSIGIHQGKKVISRSVESIRKEIRAMTRHPEWKGVISDIGGATAEMYGSDCDVEGCRRTSCLHPKMCGRFSPGDAYLDLLRVCRKMPGIRKILLGSGIRYDLLMQSPELLEEIMRHHTGGFLRIAPEHTEDRVLELMRKPSFQALESFVEHFSSINRRLKRKVEPAPYLIVGHPGEEESDVHEMKSKLTSLGLQTTSVQIFTPTPGSLSTAMYYAECDASFRPIPVEKRIGELVKRKEILTSGRA